VTSPSRAPLKGTSSPAAAELAKPRMATRVKARRIVQQ
jgi:hypothetical protein